jgi:hypothetical protein
VPLGLTLIEVQKYARRAEQLAVLKTFAEGELLRRLPFRNLVGAWEALGWQLQLEVNTFRACLQRSRQPSGPGEHSTALLVRSHSGPLPLGSECQRPLPQPIT